MVTLFCQRLGWTGMEAILEQLSSRIEYGAQRDLLDLLRLDCLTVQSARMLYCLGIKSIAELASASSRSVLSALTKLIPFQRLFCHLLIFLVTSFVKKNVCFAFNSTQYVPYFLLLLFFRKC